MPAPFQDRLQAVNPGYETFENLQTLQSNLGNLHCSHCHVDALSGLWGGGAFFLVFG